MSDRAMYILREQGATTIRVDRYGGPRVMYNLLFGSAESALAAVRSAGEITPQLTSAATGALSVDLDARRIVYFGSPAKLGIPRLRRAFHLYIQGMFDARQRSEPGWSIAWAHEEISSIADAIGHSRSYLVGGTHWTREPGNFHQLRPLEELTREPEGACVVTMRSSDGSLRDLALSAGYFPAGASFLLHGEAALPSLLLRRAIGALPHERDVTSGAFVDLGARTLELWTSAPNHWLQTSLAAIWPGWNVSLQAEGFPRQVRASGRDPAPITCAAEDEIAEALRVALEAFYGSYPSELAEQYARIGGLLYEAGWADEDPMKLEIGSYGDDSRSRAEWYEHTLEMVRRMVRGDVPRWRESVLLYERDPDTWEARFGENPR